MLRAAQLDAFFAENERVALVQIKSARGSTPRETGAEMFVTPDRMIGTIGGGQLEALAVDAARSLLSAGHDTQNLDIPLGPEIGQCCGGHVSLSISRMAAANRQAVVAEARQREASRRAVYVLGAGHVGRALADQMQFLSLRVILVDSRASELDQCVASVETRLSAVPEAEIRTAPANSAFIILTYDHGLDFLLAEAALARGDAAYVGMIGSATKRAKFNAWLKETNVSVLPDPLVCPIGAGCPDKRPETIALMVAGEVVRTMSTIPQSGP